MKQIKDVMDIHSTQDVRAYAAKEFKATPGAKTAQHKIKMGLLIGFAVALAPTIIGPILLGVCAYRAAKARAKEEHVFSLPYMRSFSALKSRHVQNVTSDHLDGIIAQARRAACAIESEVGKAMPHKNQYMDAAIFAFGRNDVDLMTKYNEATIRYINDPSQFDVTTYMDGKVIRNQMDLAYALIKVESDHLRQLHHPIMPRNLTLEQQAEEERQRMEILLGQSCRHEQRRLIAAHQQAVNGDVLDAAVGMIAQRLA
jgi:hypothetical protein